MLRWHLRSSQVPVIQINERRRFVGFDEPVLVGSVGLYVGATGDPDASLLKTTTAKLEDAGRRDLIWRGVAYGHYIFKKMTGWKPVLSPPRGDPFERAHPD
jgi:hypothetical protein